MFLLYFSLSLLVKNEKPKNKNILFHLHVCSSVQTKWRHVRWLVHDTFTIYLHIDTSGKTPYCFITFSQGLGVQNTTCIAFFSFQGLNPANEAVAVLTGHIKPTQSAGNVALQCSLLTKGTASVFTSGAFTNKGNNVRSGAGESEASGNNHFLTLGMRPAGTTMNPRDCEHWLQAVALLVCCSSTLSLLFKCGSKMMEKKSLSLSFFISHFTLYFSAYMYNYIFIGQWILTNWQKFEGFEMKCFVINKRKHKPNSAAATLEPNLSVCWWNIFKSVAQWKIF